MQHSQVDEEHCMILTDLWLLKIFKKNHSASSFKTTIYYDKKTNATETHLFLVTVTLY